LQIEDLIRERGPMTVAAFMERALYDSTTGYYARAARRSGRAGDFFTSVDVGAIFGELLAAQIAEMAEILKARVSSLKDVLDTSLETSHLSLETSFSLVEAGAGNGRLASDILRALRRDHRSVYDRIQLHLVESSAAARAAQRTTLGDVADRLGSSAENLPPSFDGVLLANELFDAMPVHQVVMRQDGLREVYVDAARGKLVLVEGPPSTPALAEYLARLHVTLEPGWRVEINLRAAAWMRDAARALGRGFVIAIDYGHEAAELYSATHAGGTLTSFAAHTMSGAEAGEGTPAWLHQPGERDITAHVDFTSLRAAAESEGLQTLGFLDQTYFLLGLANLEKRGRESFSSVGGENDSRPRFSAFKTLVMPGGLGSTHKVLLLGKGVGTPALRGCSYRVRVT
jgi:SAM-dependent MidA family methyltransferase